MDYRAVVLPGQRGANWNLHHLWREVVLVGERRPVEGNAAVDRRLWRGDVLPELDRDGAQVDLALDRARRLHLVDQAVEREGPDLIAVGGDQPAAVATHRQGDELVFPV